MDPYERENFMSASMAVALPLIQAVISGAIAGVFIYAVARLTGQERPGTWALTIGAATAAALWFASLRAWRQIVYQLEAATGRDLDGDRQIGAPAEPVRVEVASEDGRHVEYIDLPASQEQLVRLAAGLLEGATLSEAAWTGADNIFSRAEFTQLRNEMIRRGLARWNNSRTPARGATLTAPGQACMRYFASLASSSSPTLQRKA